MIKDKRSTGHTPTIHAGSELLEFTPTDQLQQTMGVVMKNPKAAT